MMRTRRRRRNHKVAKIGLKSGGWSQFQFWQPFLEFKEFLVPSQCMVLMHEPWDRNFPAMLMPKSCWGCVLQDLSFHTHSLCHFQGGLYLSTSGLLMCPSIP